MESDYRKQIKENLDEVQRPGMEVLDVLVAMSMMQRKKSSDGVA
jgi:hypothetical protein